MMSNMSDKTLIVMVLCMNLAMPIQGNEPVSHSGHSQGFIDGLSPGKREISIPTIDLSNDADRHVIIARGTESVRHGHASTVLSSNGKTMHIVWTLGHGGPVRFLKASSDGGVTWSDFLPMPENWPQHRNCPTFFRLTAPGMKSSRLFVFAQNGPAGKKMYQSFSEDGGNNWSPFAPTPRSDGDGFLTATVMPFTAIVPVDGGKELLGATNLRRPGEDFPTNVVAQSRSRDGGKSWADWEIILDLGEPFMPCEPDLIRSPDGKQILMIIRENRRSYNSWIMLSEDEGRSWSKPFQATASVTMDRHWHRYAPDGRLVIAGRDVATESPTRRQFVAWVGTYDDLLHGREGEYRLKLLPHYGNGNVEYPALEVLSDGTFIATNSVVYRPGENYSVVNTRFRLDEFDGLEPTKRGGAVVAPRR